MTASKRVPLYERLPEIYRIQDGEQAPPDQLKSFLGAVETAFDAIHENIEALYDDLFIDTCDPWVIAYIADLLGSSHLKGDVRTLRADVADTVGLRRRKGTRGGIERLADNLTGWPCRCVELFPQLAWSQHLNHQRPDAGGVPPYGSEAITRFTVPRGGTVPIRDPAMLSLLSTPFDPFAYTVDVKPAADGALHINIPNLAIYLWRLEAYRLAITIPLVNGFIDLGPPPAGTSQARFGLRFDLDPLDRSVKLFNTYRRPEPAASGADRLTEADSVPGPIIAARLNSHSEAGQPESYISVDLFDDSVMPPTGLDVSDSGLQIYIPQGVLDGINWTFRGDNLCNWENGLQRPLQQYEIVIDPRIGRTLVGVAAATERDTMIEADNGGHRSRCYIHYTYGAPGPVGAHPVARGMAGEEFNGETVFLQPVTSLDGMSLQTALDNMPDRLQPYVVEIRDNLVHDLDVSALSGVINESALDSITLNRSLIIRAASGFRPIIRLHTPLAFRPVDPGAEEVRQMTVRFEGVFITAAAGFSGDALIMRSAVARLEFDGCTIDPGGHRLRDDDRAPMQRGLLLENGYGFADSGDEDAFEPTPDILLYRSITGAVRMDDGYRLSIHHSIVDGGKTVGEESVGEFAITAANNPDTDCSAPLDMQGATFFGRVRVAEAVGNGGVFTHALQVLNDQKGCLKFCCFSGVDDRLPSNYGCVTATDARLVFTSSWHGDPGYAQLDRDSDFRILNRGPGDDAMGAYGFLLESHKWINLGIRLREFMPVGIRPLLLPVT